MHSRRCSVKVSALSSKRLQSLHHIANSLSVSLSVCLLFSHIMHACVSAAKSLHHIANSLSVSLSVCLLFSHIMHACVSAANATTRAIPLFSSLATAATPHVPSCFSVLVHATT